MSKLNGKVAIVTGGSKGIGAGISTALGAAGAAVVVNYASSREAADRVVEQIIAAGGKAIAVQGDMSKAADVDQLFAETKAEYGRLDILVNNAGVFQFDPIETFQEEEFHREFDINVLGPLLTIQRAIKQMPDGGSIINLSSVYALNPGPASAIYSGTKAAVDTITKVAARELGARKIRVNSLLPGVTRTPASRRSKASRTRSANSLLRIRRSAVLASPKTSRVLRSSLPPMMQRGLPEKPSALEAACSKAAWSNRLTSWK